MPIDDDPDEDTSSGEGRFGRQRVQKYSGWAAAVAIAVTIIIVGVVFYYRAKLAAL